MNDELNKAVKALITTLREPHEPADLMRQAAELLQKQIGHKLFTILLVAANREDTVRVYSDNLSAYPVNRIKRMGVTLWGNQVIHECQVYIGKNDDDIRWAFPDHELIKSLGLSSALSIPIVYNGQCLAVLNLQHEANWYRDEHVAIGESITPILIPPILALQKSLLPSKTDSENEYHGNVNDGICPDVSQ
jgi:hypothetical protein